MIDGKYEYFAFISYRWEDEKMARWLQEKLEHYKLPTSLREQNPNLPTHIRPIFRDKTDLNGHTLEESLMSALESSRYLIVICSPLATQSEWVNRGIQSFIDLGREKDIIPFIIDGEANADDPKNECFPLALRSLKGERAIYGININDNGRDVAAVKVVSRMFDVKYDTLWNRFLLEQKRRRRYTIAGLVAAILVVAVVAGYIWTQNQELDKRNLQIETQYQELQTKNAQIEQQNKDLDAKSDSIQTVKDSILLAYEQLDLSERNLAKSNADLKESNTRLAIEMENVKKANWETQINYAKLVAEKANTLISEDCYVNARDILLSVIPNKQSGNQKPLVPEVIQAFRKSFKSNSHRLSYSNPSHHNIRISNNNEMLATFGYGRDVVILNVLDGKQKACITIDRGFIRNILFEDENKMLIFTSDSVLTYNIDNQSKCDSKPLNGDYFDYRDGNVLSIKNPTKPEHKFAFVQDCHSGNTLQFKINSDKNIYCAKLYEDKSCLKVVIADSDGFISIFDVLTGVCEKKWRAHTNHITSIDVNEYKNLIATKGRSTGLPNYEGNNLGGSGLLSDSLKIWDITKEETVIAQDITPSAGGVRFSHYGDYIFIRRNNRLQVLSTINGKSLKESLVSMGDADFSVSSDHGKESFIFFTVKGDIQIWDIGNLSNKPATHDQGYVNFIPNAFSPDGITCVCAYKDTLKFYDYKKLQEIKNVPVYEKTSSFQISSLAYSKNGQTLALSFGPFIQLWDTKTFSKINEIRDPKHHFSMIDASGNYVLSYNSNFIKLYNLRVSNKDFKTITHTSSINYATFDPLTNHIVSAHDDGYVRFWDSNSLQCTDSLKIHDVSVYCVQFTKDGKKMVTCSADKRIIIWDRRAKKVTHTLHDHTNQINYVAFSFDGKYIISTSYDRNAKIWDTESGVLLDSFENYNSIVALNKENNWLMYMDTPTTFKIVPYKTFEDLIEDGLK